MQLRVISPDALLVETTTPEVLVKTVEGSLGILDHHAAMIATLAPGKIQYRKEGEWAEIPSGSGVLEVQDNTVLILLDE